MKTWNEPGRGRKGCPKCGIYIGVRSMKCQCGFSWIIEPRKPAPKKKAAVTQESGSNGEGSGLSLIHAPPGFCPVELKGLETEQVRQWLKELVKFHLANKQLLKPYAAKYYGRLFYGVFTDEYFELSQKIDTMAVEVGLYVD